MGKIVQKLIRWMPLVLLFLFFMVDRENSFHVVGFISLLFIYATILIMRVFMRKNDGMKSLILVNWDKIHQFKR